MFTTAIGRRRPRRLGRAVAIALAWVAGLFPAAMAAPPPNIVVILADDLGYADVGFTGGTEIATPSIDAIARAGVIARQAYVPASVCSPSRAGLLTGRYPQRFGHENNLPEAPIIVGPGLPLTEVTMANRLHDAGYVTGLIGKWHLGWTWEQHPNQRGFDEFFGFIGGTSRYNPPVPLQRNGVPVAESRHATRAFAEEAVDFIRRHADRPFFLYLAFNAPHVPLEPTAECVARYTWMTDLTRRNYAGLVCGLDAAVGQVAAALAANGLESRTLVFFLGDNGGNIYQGARNTPLRSGKASPYEGGARVPFAVRWPGMVPAGKLYGGKVSSLDIMPTATLAAGVAPMTDRVIDGVDLLPYLRGTKTTQPHANLFYRMCTGTGREGNWARMGALKLVNVRSVLSPAAVYDIGKDIGETRNILTAANVLKLQTAFQKWESAMMPPLWQMQVCE